MLLKCPECGKEFSSFAECCPQCGYPTKEILKGKTELSSQGDNPDKVPSPPIPEDKGDTEVKAIHSDVKSIQPVVKPVPQEETSAASEDALKDRKQIKKYAIGILVIAIVGLGIGSFAYLRDSQSQKDQASQVDTTLVVHSMDSVATDATEAEPVTSEETSTPFTSTYKSLLQNSKEGSEYFLYDITGDGIPELWLKEGGYEAEYELKVFDKDGNLIYQGGAWHTSFYKGNNYIISYMAAQGEYEISKLTYSNGKIHSRVIKSGNLTPEQTPDDYPEVKEEEVYMSDATDESQLETQMAK